ncbi:flavodoxin domain-containing protein [Yoonia sp. R2331]|uniref:flavodoxin domain-containing protein n=1 Tax=Yoonia sp. R2331 TaxID=3237238 RepID=UPI0034E52BFE
MSVLILFDTIEGHTAKIAAFAQNALAAVGQSVVMCNTSDQKVAPDFSDVTHVVLAAPVHERRHPETFEVVLNASSEELSARKTLLLSVSLNAAFADGLAEAQDYVDEMALRTGFSASDVMLVAGAVKTGSYDYFETQVVRHVLLSDRPYDPSDGEREFTYWDALTARLTRFAAS